MMCPESIMQRVADWPERLDAAIRRAAATPFAWGRNDCLLFAADVIEAVTGDDVGARFRNRYTTARGALRVMARHGWADVAEALDAHLPRTACSFARRGDIVMHADSAGVVIGADAAFLCTNEDATSGFTAMDAAAGSPGLVMVPRADWTGAWMVGR